jgi:hypothetical protein
VKVCRYACWFDVIRGGCAIAVSLVLLSSPDAAAQTSSAGPNQGALTFQGGFDVPSVYFFRGIRQEGDPKLTLWPSATLAIRLRSTDRSEIAADVGIWQSLHTGTSGTGGPEQKLQYEEDFTAGVVSGLGRRFRARAAFVAYTSPNESFDTIKEVNLQVAETGQFQPYAIIAFELSDSGQRDNGLKRGTYLELGASPHWSPIAGRLGLSVPVKAGFSLNHYYELLGSDLAYHDHRFGFFQVGGLVTLPLTPPSSRYGSWQVHGGADLLGLGTTTQALNKNQRSAVVARVGVGVSY